ncbi:MAG: hypothetical protein QM749_18160 [Aquabacterium sp.]
MSSVFLDLGFDDYLSKPFRQSQLQKILIEHTHAEGLLSTQLLDEEGEPTTVPMGLREMAFVPTPDDATQATHAAPETPDDVAPEDTAWFDPAEASTPSPPRSTRCRPPYPRPPRPP